MELQAGWMGLCGGSDWEQSGGMRSVERFVSVAAPDPKQLPADVNLHKAAAWMMVSRAILNLDETITKE